MIGIRTDANDRIAMGHLMRCMSIAKQLKAKNLDVKFILSEDDAGSLLAENGFPYLCLHNKYNEKEREINRLAKLLRKEKIDRLLLDSYEVTSGYMKKLQEVCKVIYIDDLNRFRYPADLVVNYTYGADMSLYSPKGYRDGQFLLGSAYVPLRPEFAQSRIKIKENISAVFLSTGGTDEFGVLIHILKKLQKSQFKNTIKNVITGKFYKYMEELEAMGQQDGTICHYHDIQDICSIMHKSDLAISAGGTTLSELCACGIPTVCISIADNQHAGIKAYADAKLLFYAGDIRDDREGVSDRVVQMAELMKNDYALRESMGEKAKKVIDGKGALRIAEAVESMCP